MDTDDDSVKRKALLAQERLERVQEWIEHCEYFFATGQERALCGGQEGEDATDDPTEKGPVSQMDLDMQVDAFGKMSLDAERGAEGNQATPQQNAYPEPTVFEDKNMPSTSGVNTQRGNRWPPARESMQQAFASTSRQPDPAPASSGCSSD